MQSVNLSSFITFPLSLIAENEFLYYSLPNNSVNTNKNLIRESLSILNKKTKRLFISLESSDDLGTFLNFNSNNLPSMVGVKLSVNEYKKFSMGNDVQFNNCNFDTIANFQNLKKITPTQVDLIPEIDFTTNVVQVGPTIYKLFEEFNLPFLFISLNGPPTSSKVLEIKKIFEYLRLRGLKKKIYFNFNNQFINEWNIKTLNTFSGMQMMHIDLSNKCTHSCVFCGVWGPDFIENVKIDNAGKIPAQFSEFMNRQISMDIINQILADLPETVDKIQFGGVGDPLTHPHWQDIVLSFRKRGIRVEILTNLDCINDTQLETLHNHSRSKYSMHLYVNLSAGTSKTYSIIRPRQDEKVFIRILKNIEFLKTLNARDNHGVCITMLHVINRYNYRDMSEMVKLGHQHKSRVWLKPLEVHSEIHKRFEIPSEEKHDYLRTMQEAISLAKELDVELIHDSINYFKGEKID